MITVIVMLILAGVAISVITDDGGLFDKTRGAAEAYENAAQREAQQINDLMNDIDLYLSGLPVVPEKPKMDGRWNGKVNSPKLLEGMTAVYWDQNGQEIELTSSDTKEEWEKWYDYTEQTGSTSAVNSGTSRWANAVTKDSNGNITGYWVWIPRYEYKLTAPSSGAKAGVIDINFISTDITTPSTSEYKIHPVFINDTAKGGWSSEIPGFWVAKYIAGFQKRTVNTSGVIINQNDQLVSSTLKYTDSSYTKNALDQNVSALNCTNVNISYPVFKPLTYIYDCINIDSMFRISQDIKNATNFYGLTNTADSHLMKNSEWGAVAYLAWSKYGRNATEPHINNVYMGNAENSSKSMYGITGLAANNPTDSNSSGRFTGNPYNTPKGQLASSTGNITGVYDLSGGVYEYVAAYIENTAGATNRTKYGAALVANNENVEKYRSRYLSASGDTNTSNWSANSVLTRYGDAVLETSTSGSSSNGWNTDYSSFPYSSSPFFMRGGHWSDTTSAGLFMYNASSGAASYIIGFRACIV